jgi:hypothetical protein
MTPLREAFVLPGLFLTVTLVGGLRISDGIRLMPPPLSAIVLAVVLLSAMVRAGVLVPAAFLEADRRPLENLSGAVVLLTLVVASAQAIGLVVPDRGLLHFAFSVFLFVQLLSLSAARIDRVGMLRSLFVLLGSFFVLRFIVLESLYAADGGTLKRVLTALMAGVTLGGVEYQPHAPVMGYIAFGTLALYVAGLVMLPRAPVGPTSALARTVRDGLPVPLLILSLAAASGAACGGLSQRTEAERTNSKETNRRASAQRDAMLASARVWMPPVVAPGHANLGTNPEGPGRFDERDEVECRLVVEPVSGLTSKFDCQLPDKTIVKVKYGAANAELHAEVATTRLLTALGFAADRMYVVRGVKCAGCPRFPFRALRCLGATGLQWPCFPLGIDFDRTRTFDPVVIEHQLPGRKIEAFPRQGWAWYELDAIDPDKGGSPRAHVDGLRLLAAFLAHWDNKAENQRLLCPAGADLPDGGCATPIAMMQDVGATFGPAKLDLHNWRRTPVWSDRAACRVSMKDLPWGGGTFPERQVSEEGRQFLLGLIAQLSVDQIRALFTTSRAIMFDAIDAESRSASAWADAFLEKVEQIRSAGPCPSA